MPGGLDQPFGHSGEENLNLTGMRVHEQLEPFVVIPLNVRVRGVQHAGDGGGGKTSAQRVGLAILLLLSMYDVSAEEETEAMELTLTGPPKEQTRRMS